jgi:hypothetical protein
MLLDKTLVDWRRELKRRKKRGKVWRNDFVNLFFRENWVESAWKYFLWKVSKKFFETNLEKISDAVVFPVMKHEYEMRVRWIYWRLLDVEGKNNLLKIEIKRKVNLFDFWKDFFFYENVFVEIDLNLKEKEFHWISKDSQLI